MVFNTPIFFFFFIIFLFFYGFVFLRQKPRVYFILVASLVFYGAWNYKFIPLLVGGDLRANIRKNINTPLSHP